MLQPPPPSSHEFMTPRSFFASGGLTLHQNLLFSLSLLVLLHPNPAKILGSSAPPELVPASQMPHPARQNWSWPRTSG